jgi:hypothetical protein
MAGRYKAKSETEIELEKLLGPPVQIDEEQERRLTEALKVLLGERSSNEPSPL